MVATIAGNPEIVRIFIEAGAKPNLQNNYPKFLKFSIDLELLIFLLNQDLLKRRESLLKRRESLLKRRESLLKDIRFCLWS